MADEQNTGGIIEKLRNSPRTVSTIIVILIIAGAIFAFSDRDTSTSPSPEAEGEAAEQAEGEKAEASAEEAEGEQEEQAETATSEEATPTVPVDEEQQAEATPAPESQETTEAFVQVAQRGDGVTHLARRSANSYLSANPPDFELTNEHRVYVEDYIKDRVAKRRLRKGEQVKISKDLIREAVAQSKNLSDAQLNNLQKYSQRVQWQ